MYKIIGADQKEYGPVTADQVKEWIAQRRADGNTLIQPEGETGWRPVSAFPEFAAALGAASVVPAPPQFRQPSGAQVPNYLVHAILCTLCCCPPTGIAAIVYAAQVNSKLAAGDTVGAKESSDKAKLWCWVSLGLGIVANVVSGILTFLSVAKNLPQ